MSMNWILSMKVILISAGIVTVAAGLPIAVSEIPAIWSVILSWMKPPYLYLIINGIIITIAATSRFHQSHSEPPTAARSEELISVKTPPETAFEPIVDRLDISNAVEVFPPAAEVVVSAIEDSVVELKPVMVNGSISADFNFNTEDEIVVQTVAEGEITEDVIVDSALAYTIPPPPPLARSSEVRLETLFPAREKPPVSSRFVNRKPSRNTPEGARGLRVAKPKKQDTLESTWKMITEGRHVPLTRHLKKSDTFEREHHVAPAVNHVPKSETFKDRTKYELSAPAPAPVKIRKEPSLSHDELNRRVEAFITKFNEDMRMQRQESLNQYMEMINRGV